MPNPFTRHPTEIGETYGEHFAAASSFGLVMIGAGLACLIHAVLPFAFTHTASRSVHRLNQQIATKRRPEMKDHWVI